MAALLTRTYGMNENNTKPEELGAFASNTISSSRRQRLHMNWMQHKCRVECDHCRRKNKHFTTVMNATKHGDPPITVAGAAKKRSKARKVYMPSGATIMHSTSLRRNDVVALLEAKGEEAVKRRMLRRTCIHFMVTHRTFPRLDFAEVLRAAKTRVKTDESDHRNLFKGETNRAVEEWLEAQGSSMLSKTPVYLTRGQFIRVMRNFGFDAKEDMRNMNRMFSSYDVNARDYVDMNIFCTAFMKHQLKVRAMRFGHSHDKGGARAAQELAAANALGGAGVADVIKNKQAVTATEEKAKMLLREQDFYPND